MRKIFMVVRREYLERIKKKSFWIGTALFPLLLIGMFGIQILAATLRTGEQRKIAFIDATGSLYETVRDKLSEYKLGDGRQEYLLESVPVEDRVESTRQGLEPRVLAGEFYGIVVAGADLDAEDNFGFYGESVSDFQATKTLERAVRDAVILLRARDRVPGLTRDSLAKLLAPIELGTFQLSQSGGARKRGEMDVLFGTFAFVMVLYMSLLFYGIAMLRGVLEEKTNRVMEVLLGSLTPNQLMTGKIVGIGLVGLTQITIYALTAGALRLYVTVQQVQGDIAGIFDNFSPGRMVLFLVYFVLGYFLYTTLFAAVGSVCNSEEEAQNLQMPLVMCLVVPMLATFFFIRAPNSTLAVVTSLIPLFTPMVMYMRVSQVPVPWWQIALSVVLMAGAIWLFFRGAAKVFRIGVLMYGKRPTIPEILRWARG